MKTRTFNIVENVRNCFFKLHCEEIRIHTANMVYKDLHINQEPNLKEKGKAKEQ